jgi:hypothetical protein
MAGSESRVGMMVRPLSVVAARRLRSHYLEFAGLESLDGGRNSWKLRQVHLDVHGLKFPKCAHANAANHHPVHAFTGKGQERLAHAMAMIDITVRDRVAGSVFRVDNQKKRR